MYGILKHVKGTKYEDDYLLTFYDGRQMTYNTLEAAKRACRKWNEAYKDYFHFIVVRLD